MRHAESKRLVKERMQRDLENAEALRLKREEEAVLREQQAAQQAERAAPALVLQQMYRQRKARKVMHRRLGIHRNLREWTRLYDGRRRMAHFYFSNFTWEKHYFRPQPLPNIKVKDMGTGEVSFAVQHRWLNLRARKPGPLLQCVWAALDEEFPPSPGAQKEALAAAAKRREDEYKRVEEEVFQLSRYAGPNATTRRMPVCVCVCVFDGGKHFPKPNLFFRLTFCE